MRHLSIGAVRGWRVIAVLLACTACSTAAELAPGVPEPARGSVVITAGNTTGVYYAWSQQLAQQLKLTNPQLHVTVERSDGSVQNLQRLRDGTADLGLTTVDATEPTLRTDLRTDLSPVAVDAGQARATAGVPLRALGRISDDYVQVVVRSDSGLRSVADLAGRRVAVNTPGSGTALVAGRLLKTARISVIGRDLGVADGMAALERRDLDAVIWSGGI